MLKRINRELTLWNTADMGEVSMAMEDTPIVITPYCEICCPRGYPFRSPKIRGMQFVKNILDPELWCITILSSPCLLSRIPKWGIDCMCCHSLTCQNNWHTSHRLEEVAKEALFHAVYKQLGTLRVQFPAALPIDVLEYMAHLSK